MTVRIALIGDHDPQVTAHQAIPLALEKAKPHIHPATITFDWLHTASIGPLHSYHGIWCVPASPYADESAALNAIRYAREHSIPFLGTCGGFQHAVIEFARNVLGIEDASHEETNPHSPSLLISRLACSLVEVDQTVTPLPATHLARACGTVPIHFGYHCNYGLNPAFAARMQQSGLRVSARDSAGEVRAIELEPHPFFVATLFQPERTALHPDSDSPLVNAFAAAASAYRKTHPLSHPDTSTK